MDSPTTQPHGASGETPTQKQARLRRERREAKIKEGGTSRLEKITNVSGRQNLPEPTNLVAGSSHADPDEVDLSAHLSAARTPISPSNGGQPSEADIRALLRGAGPQPGVNDPQQQQQGDEDPMMQMLQQMMGGMPGVDGQSGGGQGGLPPALAAMLGTGGMGGVGGHPTKEDKYGYLWKIVHAIFALVLGIYITATSHAFTGDISRGGISGTGHEGGRNVFWAFATAELVLQSSRFFLERGGDSRLGGWVGFVGNMLPEPYRGWLMLAARYSGIWSTVVEDGMVVVFVVGFVAWWKGSGLDQGRVNTW